jgi:hydroxymethylglutaryl-CoA synthase
MIIKKDVGIVSYGAYLPSLVITAEEIERAQGKVGSGIPRSLGVQQKTVPSIDEDTVTLATAAGFQAITRWGSEKNIHKIGTMFIGSESHPYAVKPSGTIVKEALGFGDSLALADLQFACKAGTQSLQIAMSYVLSELAEFGFAIGADTAQSRPGDILEFTAGAGAAAFIVGRENVIAKLLATTSIATDTPDFWRRPGQNFPEHAGRFSGEPAYFKHVGMAAKQLLAEVQLQPKDIDFCVFHTPNAKFPQAIAAQLGFTMEQLKPSLVVQQIGNTYAAASLLALSAVLDQAKAGQKILVTSYGSGSGSDSFLFETTPLLVEKRKQWNMFVQDFIAQTKPISYQEYQQNTGQAH